MASCARDWKIKIWTFDDFLVKEVKTLLGHSAGVLSIVHLPNGHLASSSRDSTIRIWDLDKEPSLVKTIFGHSDIVYCLALLEDGNLASGSVDQAIKIWHFNRHSKYYPGNLILF
jgi:WD40 repeat protein